jgi:hypothetical protein
MHLAIADPWADLMAAPAHGERVVAWMRAAASAPSSVPVVWEVEPPPPEEDDENGEDTRTNPIP